MKAFYLALALCLFSSSVKAQDQNTLPKNQGEENKEIAQKFYQDLWFSNNTDKYYKYVAEEYVVHDIGERKAVLEPAIEQKNIADFFWKHGEFDCRIDYQIAEGDLVATRWTGTFKANTLFGRLALQTPKPISIINVFRIKKGKIVEFWNHRHDIETPQTLKFTLKGFVTGLLTAFILTVLLFRRRKDQKTLAK